MIGKFIAFGCLWSIVQTKISTQIFASPVLSPSVIACGISVFANIVMVSIGIGWYLGSKKCGKSEAKTSMDNKEIYPMKLQAKVQADKSNTTIKNIGVFPGNKSTRKRSLEMQDLMKTKRQKKKKKKCRT